MESKERDSGIEAIGDVPWGTHFCLFYKTGDDLSDILVSFFKAGVRNNEFCMCVTADPVNADEMRRLMGSAMPDFNDYVSKGQIEIIPYAEWYLIDGVFDYERVLEGWNEKLQRAQERGFDGARLTGNTFWLDKPIWKDFLEYERAVDRAFAGRNIIALCAYSLDRCGANEIIDVVSAHMFAMTRRDGEWSVIESRGLKETRKALLESEEKLRSFFDLPLIGMALTSPEKGWIYANDRICEILGFSREELSRLTWDKITYPDDLDNDLEHFNMLLSGEIDSYTIEKRFVRKDGRIVQTQISIGCVRDPDNSVRYIAGLMQDITERKQAEESLKLTQFALDNFKDSAIWFSMDGGIIYVNDEACRSLGCSREELLSMHLWDIDPDVDYPRGMLIWDELKRQGGSGQFERRHIARDGRVFPVDVTACYTRYEDKEYIISFDRDVTGRKRAEEAMNRLLHDLGDRVKELTALHRSYNILQKGRSVQGVLQEITDILPPAWQYPEITAARITFDGLEFKTPNFLETPWIQRADFHTSDGKHGSIEVVYLETRQDEIEDPFLVEERDLINSLAEMIRIYLDKQYAEEALTNAKSQAELYLDLMGHDISNMHQVALGYLELARDMSAGEEQAVSLDKPVEVLQRSAKLISNVRKLQKLHDGVFQTQDVDVCRVLVDVQRECGVVPNKTIALSVNGLERCHVRANELLHDLFANLVNNAIKHTGDHADIVIDLDVVNHDGGRYCRVMVEDDGPGIPDDFKAKIFNRTLKGTDKAKGIGLGLYLAKSLVDSYGGKIWVEDRIISDHSKGARFVVMLPAV